MFKFITMVSLLCYGFGNNTVMAQGADTQLFEVTCKAILQQHERFLINKNLAGIAILVEDPITGEQDIVFEGDTTQDVVRNFRKLDRTGQLEILRNENLPVFPLKDSLFIIDTLKFFSAGLSYSSGKCFFKVIRQADKHHENTQAVYLSALGNLPPNRRKEQFYLCFAFPGRGLWGYYYFIRQQGRYTLSSSSLSSGNYCSGG